jgi:hypothetical protein
MGAAIREGSADVDASMLAHLGGKLVDVHKHIAAALAELAELQCCSPESTAVRVASVLALLPNTVRLPVTT